MSSGDTVAMVVFSFMLVTTFAIYYLRSRENMALIERGINPRQNRSLPAPFTSLKYGLLLLGCGIGLTAAFFIDANIEPQKFIYGDGSVSYRKSTEALYFSLIAVGGGLGLVISYFIERKAWKGIEKDINQ